MIVLSLLLVLGSAAMLVVGLASATQILIWASIAASVGAAGALATAVVRRRADPDQQLAAAVEAHTRALTAGATGTTTVVGDAGRHRAEQTGARQDPAQPVRPPDPPGEPPEEDVSASDVLRVIDLLDEVLVVDGRPRYHLPGCSSLIGRETIPLPVSEARAAEFTPCAWCHPDRTLAAQSRNDPPGS